MRAQALRVPRRLLLREGILTGARAQDHLPCSPALSCCFMLRDLEQVTYLPQFSPLVCRVEILPPTYGITGPTKSCSQCRGTETQGSTRQHTSPPESPRGVFLAPGAAGGVRPAQPRRLLQGQLHGLTNAARSLQGLPLVSQPEASIFKNLGLCLP